MQGVFEHVKGVTRVVAGYSGARRRRRITAGRHRMRGTLVRGVTFDPRVVACGGILRVCFSVARPAELNRRGPDSGTSYRSEFSSPRRRRRRCQGLRYLSVLSSVTPLANRAQRLYAAEGYHQDY